VVSTGGFQHCFCVWIVATAVLITLVRPFAPSGYLKLLRPIIRGFDSGFHHSMLRDHAGLMKMSVHGTQFSDGGLYRRRPAASDTSPHDSASINPSEAPRRFFVLLTVITGSSQPKVASVLDLHVVDAEDLLRLVHQRREPIRP
jgi:hypothetical protein